MTKDREEAPAQPQDEPQRQTRGGAADVDRSKGFETDAPFRNPEQDAAQTRKEVPDGETP